jgi:uncharacterized protein YraI
MLLSTIALVTILSCSDKQSVSEAFVAAEGGLRMRSAPDIAASPVGLIPNSTKVQVIEEADATVTIAGNRGKWTKVAYSGGSGWVFGYFLASEPPKTASDTNLQVIESTELAISFDTSEGKLTLMPGGTATGTFTEYNGCDFQSDNGSYTAQSEGFQVTLEGKVAPSCLTGAKNQTLKFFLRTQSDLTGDGASEDPVNCNFQNGHYECSI